MNGWIPPHTYDPRCGDMLSAVMQEIRIEIEPHKYFGPPRSAIRHAWGDAGRKIGEVSLRSDPKWGPPQYETLTCMGKSWRNHL